MRLSEFIGSEEGVVRTLVDGGWFIYLVERASDIIRSSIGRERGRRVYVCFLVFVEY